MNKYIPVILLVLIFGINDGTAGEYRPLRDFLQILKTADKIVVRNGGMNCCGPVDKNPILFEITDPEKIKEFALNIKVKSYSNGESCMCCGWPGIDFYKNGKRIGLTSIKHGTAIWWPDLEVTLTPESQKWLREWLITHGISEELMNKNDYPTFKKDKK